MYGAAVSHDDCTYGAGVRMIDMSDGTPGDGYFSPSSEVDVRALEDTAYERGWRAGRADRRAEDFAEGYAERGHDIVERLRTLDSIGEKELELCISEIMKMVGP